MTTTQRPRPARQAPPGPDPVPRGLILVAVAVVLGVILLVKGGGVGFERDGGDVEISTGGDTDTTAVDETTTTAPPPPATSVAPAELQVTALNSAGIDGFAGQTQQFLSVAGGYTSVTAITGAGLVEQTVVHFAEGFEADANAVAEVLGLDPSRVSPLPADQQLARNPGEFPDTTQVAVVLGPDVAPTVQGAAEGRSDADGAAEGDDAAGGT